MRHIVSERGSQEISMEKRDGILIENARIAVIVCQPEFGLTQLFDGQT